jgi:hypothetical protein
MDALASIQMSANDLSRTALAEDPSAKLRMVSYEEAVALSRNGVLFLSGYSAELGGRGYFAATADQAGRLAALQASALELVWSDVYFETVRTRLLDHFNTVVQQADVIVRRRQDGYGLEVVDATGEVRASHIFSVPGYVL